MKVGEVTVAIPKTSRACGRKLERLEELLSSVWDEANPHKEYCYGEETTPSTRRQQLNVARWNKRQSIKAKRIEKKRRIIERANAKLELSEERAKAAKAKAKAKAKKAKSTKKKKKRKRSSSKNAKKAKTSSAA